MKEFRILALAPKERPYTPLECVSMALPPVFSLCSATRREFLELMAENEINIPKGALEAAANEDGDVSEVLAAMAGENIWKTVLNSHIFNLEILKKKLKGWSNLKDSEGNELVFSHENLEYLSDELVADLVREITGQARPEEEKKSEKESSLSSGSETKTQTQTSGTVESAESESLTELGIAKESTTETPE